MTQRTTNSLEATWQSLPADKRKAFAALLRKRGIDVGTQLSIAPVDRSAPLALSYAQERLWFLAQLEPDSPAYNIAGAFSVEGPLDHARVQRSVDQLVQRHESLRTSFGESLGKPEIRLNADARCEVACIDLRDGATDLERGARLSIHAEDHAAQPFDLAVAPLLRITLVQLAEEQSALLLTMHHIVSDGWSLDLLLDEFSALYAGMAAADLPPLSAQYLDYAAWQRDVLGAGELDRQLRYWVDRLGTDPVELSLPTDLPRTAAASRHGEVVTLRIEADLAERVERRAKSEGVTVFMLLLSVFDAVLYRWSGQSDLRIGVPVANRTRVELERLVGMFVNTQVLRANVRGSDTFRQLLQHVKDGVLGAQAHAALPFEKLVEALAPERQLGRNPLFQVMYSHEASAMQESAADVSELRITPLEAAGRATQFELTFETSVDDARGEIAGAFTYADGFFKRSTIESLAGRFVRILKQVVADPTRRVADLEFLEPVERSRLMAATHPPDDRPWLAERFVHESIAEHARLRPDAIALLDESGGAWSYARLERESNQWAHRLRRAGVGPESCVGLCAGRSPRMVLGALAIFKAGGACVPLDPSYPIERLRAMVESAGIQRILGERSQPSAIELTHGEFAAREGLWLDAEDVSAEPAVAPHPGLSGEHLAYVVHTSGSTGRPKGVGVSHAAFARHVAAVGADYGMVPEDCALHTASIGFDDGVEQWVCPLVHGARLLIRGDELWSAERALEMLREHRVSWFRTSPAYLREVASAALARGEKLALRACSPGGEALPREGLATILRAVSPAPVINGYGPTETVVTPMTWHVTDIAQCTTTHAPIGRVIGPRRGYVLDGDLNLVLPGATGELYLGGACVARGYVGQHALTAQRFVPDPFAAHPGSRMYRTGDLVRCLADGSVEYVGRADHQVKLRGFRIELGEIEGQLAGLPGVREAVVVADGGALATRLIGYVAGEVDADTLRTQLRAALPDYMVPAHLVVLPELPRNQNGKVDRKRLPAPALVTRASVAPRTETERALSDIWQTVLRLPSVSVTDNFFDLGGDSIISIQVVSRARQAGFAITPRDMFQHQTIEALARVARTAEQPAIDQGPVEGEVPLTPIQLEFLALEAPKPDHFNQSVLLRCAGPLDLGRLRAAIATLVRHHDALRLRVTHEEVGVRQAYGQLETGEERVWVRFANSPEQVSALCDEAQSSLSLERGVLLRALYIELRDGTSRLLLAVHHMAVDGVSFRLLLEDLERAYAGEPLPSKTTSFAAYSRALRAYAQSSELTQELEYWRAAPSRASAVQVGTPASRADSSSLAHSALRLDKARTAQLLKLAPAAYHTQIQDLLLAAFARAVFAWSGKPLWLELESHGRSDVLEGVDVSRTVGWFTTRYPVHLDARGALSDAIKRVKEQLRAVPNQGLGYGVLAHFGTDSQREVLAAVPRPWIAFNYLGQFDAVIESGGPFALAGEASGAEWSPDMPVEHSLEVSGQIYDGELSLGFAWNQRAFEAARLRELVEACERELHAVIEHCIAPGAFGRTPSDFPLARLTQAQVETVVGSTAVIEDVYPLTPMQKGMLFHSLYAPEEAVYVTQLDVEIRGLSQERFAAAWRSALARHPVLRTSFVWRGLSEPLQRVQAATAVELEIPQIALQGFGADAQSDALQSLKAREHARGFDLESAPLFRLALADLGDCKYHFVWTCHHLLLDGWSTARLLHEVLLDTLGHALPPVGPAFAEYLRWLSHRSAESSEAFWRARLESLTAPTSLAGSLPPTAASPARSEQRQVRTQLGAAAWARVQAFAQAERVTVNTLVQAAWSLLLQRYTGQRTVALGATTSGRPADLAGSGEILGLFINTLPILATPQPEWTVRDFVQRMQSDNLAIREHEHTPLSDIQRWAGLGGKALFDTLLVFENYPVDEALSDGWEGIQFGEVASLEATNYPLTLGVSAGAGLGIAYGFASSSFDESRVERLGAQLLELLELFATQPDQRIGNLALPGEPRAQQQPRAAVPAHEAFVDRILARHARGAARDRIAVVSHSQRLSFAELERESDRIAHWLIRNGVQPGRCVGICLPREASFIAAAVGIWKAGAAYLSLDAKLPVDRLRFMIDDAEVGLVITLAQLRESLPDVRVLCLDERAPELPAGTPEVPRFAEQLAYVIYTSGSTGTPKGVGVSHAALSMHCHAVAKIYAIRPEDRALHFAPFGFDASVEQWCVSLLGGGSIRLSDDEPWTPDVFEQVIERDQVTILYPPVSHMLQLAQVCEARGRRRSGLRVCCIGGEAMPKRHVELIRRWLSPELLVNGYGPTETVVTPLLWPATPDMPCDTAYAPIGHVVGDRTGYVLDSELNVLPAGATGELYIGGTGLARGYLCRAGLTAERFVPDPFSAVPGARLYRTGDLVRMLDGGAIEYISRIDHQVKLRGVRIELGEIEAALLDQPGIAEAHALLHEEGATRTLVAYVAGPRAAPENAAELRERLRARLPDAMVPQRIVALESLPRTRHGKVDRNRLPRPEMQVSAYDPPEGEIERTLCRLWAEILGAPRVGRHDNFFELGGDSILSILVVSRAREQGILVTPRQLFSHPTIAALASVARRDGASGAAAELEPSEGEVPLTPIQRAFFENQGPTPHHFNLSVLLRPQRALDPETLARALDALVAHHPALRLRYRTEADTVVQYFGPQTNDPPVLWSEQVAPDEIEAACERAQRSLDLARGPLLRALLLHVADGSQRLLLTVHHLAIDGVSFRILLEDLSTAYAEVEQGGVPALPATTTNFKTWANRLASYATSEALARELDAWERELGGVEDALPHESEPSARPEANTSCTAVLEPALTRSLLHAAPAHFGGHVQDLILAALARSLAAWTGNAAHLVELEGHGRDAPFDDVDATRCIGWFTRLHPLRLDAAATLHETVRGIRERREGQADRSFSYGVLRELAPEPLRARMRELPRPRITFNYLGQFDSSFDADALLVPAEESPGDEVSADAAHANWLQIDVEVYQDQLRCSLLYDPGFFTHATASRLMDAFQAELQALAERAAPALASDAASDALEADAMSLKPRQHAASPLVQLGRGDRAAPVFCLHPLGGVVFDYNALARRLAGQRSVYGVQCRTLVDPSWLDTSTEDMGRAYARLIAEAQPEGPYHLLGWSFGADLAIETAHVLEQTGRRVAFLGLVDRLVRDENAVLDEDAEADADVLGMACNLLSARYPAFSRKQLLLDAHAMRKRGEADRDVVRALVAKVTGSTAAAQDSFDLDGLLVMHAILQNMYRISERFALKRLHVAPHCWWSNDSRTTQASLVQALEAGIGQRCALSADVASNHLQIVYDRGFIDSLEVVLRELER